MVLKHVQDIPEADLIKVVRTLANKGEGHSNDQFPTYFKLVLEAPRNDIFMQQAMKQLTTSELPIVLKTLSDWLDWWEQHGGGSSSVNSATEAVPGFVHVSVSSINAKRVQRRISFNPHYFLHRSLISPTFYWISISQR